MSKGGLFKSAKISYQAEQSAFVKIDIREVKEIQINAEKAKVLSVHPTGTYTLEPGANGMQVLKISTPPKIKSIHNITLIPTAIAALLTLITSSKAIANMPTMNTTGINTKHINF